MTKEIFYFDSAPQPVANDKGEMRLQGVFCATNVLSCDKGGYFARFADGCFKNLESVSPVQDILALLNHDDTNPTSVVSRTNGGFLSLGFEAGIGYTFDCKLFNTNTGRDCYELATSGAIIAMSFGVFPDCDSDGEPTGYKFIEENGQIIQQWTAGGSNLVEISFVFNPAFAATSISNAADNKAFAKFTADKQTAIAQQQAARQKHAANLLRWHEGAAR